MTVPLQLLFLQLLGIRIFCAVATQSCPPNLPPTKPLPLPREPANPSAAWNCSVRPFVFSSQSVPSQRDVCAGACEVRRAQTVCRLHLTRA